jgi:hypothetical protein
MSENAVRCNTIDASYYRMGIGSFVDEELDGRVL